MAVSAWAIAVALGFGMLARYKNGTGAQGTAPARWPDVTRIARGEKLSLVVFAHPYCPCTRASLSQLREILSSAGDGIRATVVFLEPDGDAEAVRGSRLWSSAASIPGVQLLLDETGGQDDLLHRPHRFDAVALKGEPFDQLMRAIRPETTQCL